MEIALAQVQNLVTDSICLQCKASALYAFDLCSHEQIGSNLPVQWYCQCMLSHICWGLHAKDLTDLEHYNRSIGWMSP